MIGMAEWPFVGCNVALRECEEAMRSSAELLVGPADDLHMAPGGTSTLRIAFGFGCL